MHRLFYFSIIVKGLNGLLEIVVGVAAFKGTTYMYIFDKVGTWSYHDHLNPERAALITVI